MSGYTLNSNPWGGSFILEGSTDRTSWDVMVAKSSNGTFLGREGLATGGGQYHLVIIQVVFLIHNLVFINQMEHITHLIQLAYHHTLVY